MASEFHSVCVGGGAAAVPQSLRLGAGDGCEEVLEEVREVRRGQVLEGPVGEEEEEEFEVGGASGAVGGGADVLPGAGVSEEAGSRVLDVL